MVSSSWLQWISLLSYPFTYVWIYLPATDLQFELLDQNICVLSLGTYNVRLPSMKVARTYSPISTICECFVYTSCGQTMAACFCKYNFVGTPPCPLSMAAFRQQSWVDVTENIRYTKLRRFSIWFSREKLCWSLLHSLQHTRRSYFLILSSLM